MSRARIVTLNTLYKRRARARLRVLADLLERADYDVVCLQEVVWPFNASLVSGLAESYRHKIDGGRYPLVAGGLLTLSKWPVLEHRYTVLPRMGAGRAEWLMRKGIQTVRFDMDGRPLTVVNTHLSANKAADWARGNAFAPVQVTELGCLAAEVAAAAARHPGDALVVLGDFNVPRDSWLFDDFVAATKLCDVFSGSGQTTFRPTPTWPGRALDQVLVSPGVEAEARLVFQDPIRLADGSTDYISDHYGIEAMVTV